MASTKKAEPKKEGRAKKIFTIEMETEAGNINIVKDGTDTGKALKQCISESESPVLGAWITDTFDSLTDYSRAMNKKK